MIFKAGAVFILIAIIAHAFYFRKDNGFWGFASRRFWKDEIKILLLFGIVFIPFLLFIDKTVNDQWVWESHDFYTVDWGDSPAAVQEVEDFTGRPSGSEKPPELQNASDGYSYIRAEVKHLYPFTRSRGRRPRAYIFLNNFLVAGSTYRDFSLENEENHSIVKRTVSKFEERYGKPAYEDVNQDEQYAAFFWEKNKQSYIGFVFSTIDLTIQAVPPIRYIGIRSRSVTVAKQIGKDNLPMLVDVFLSDTMI